MTQQLKWGCTYSAPVVKIHRWLVANIEDAVYTTDFVALDSKGYWLWELNWFDNTVTFLRKQDWVLFTLVWG